MSESLQTGPGGSPEEKLINPDILEFQKKLEKLGFSNISPDVLNRISQSPETKNSFSADIDAIFSKQPINENEKIFFETKYIKGYGQIVDTPFGQFSFAEIQKHEKKDEILDDHMTPEQSKAYNNWIKGLTETAITEGKKIDKDTQLAIESNSKRNEKLAETNKKLESSLKEIQGINGVPKTIPDDVRKETTKNPPKELQGVDPKDLENGKYDNIILADYYITHAQEIAKQVDPKNQERFKNSIENIGDTLGRTRTQDFEKLTSELALGSNREKIENLGEKLINDGYSADVIWNPRDRSITFRNNQGDILVIDTANIPPEERVVKNGLSIDREIPTITPREKEKKTLEKKQIELQSNVIKDSTTTQLATLQNLPKDLSAKNPKEINDHERAQQNFVEAKNPTEKLLAIEKLKISNMALDTARRTTLTAENSGSIENTKLEQEIEGERASINILEGSLTKLVHTNKQLEGYNDMKNEPDTFYNDAKKSLSYLSQIAYDELGQDTLTRVIDAINIRNKGKIAEINLSKNPKLDIAQEKELLIALAGLSRKSGIMTSWQGVDTTDAIIAARQMSSPNWRVSLQDMSKSLKFQTMKGANIVSFTQYLYEKPDTGTPTNPQV